MAAKREDPVRRRVLEAAGGSLLPWEEFYLSFHAERYRDTLALLGPGCGRRLLDVGAFPGHLTLAAQEAGFAVAGVTGRMESESTLRLIADRLGAAGIPLELADVETERLPHPDESFDAVLASEIIEHLPYNPYHLLSECFRVLKPGGRLVVTTPNFSRLHNVLAMIRGASPLEDLRGRFYISFSSIISCRHVREYTGEEMRYLLEAQDKELYRFEDVRIHYSRCLDPGFRWSRAPAWLAERFWPRMRGDQMAVATKPANLTLLAPERLEPATGLHPVERHVGNACGISQVLTTPFRWTAGRAGLALPASAAPWQVFFLHVVNLKPEAMAPERWEASVEGRPVAVFRLAPDRAYSLLALALPGTLAHDGVFHLRLEGPGWVPREQPAPDGWEYSLDDGRELGLVIGWDGVLRQDFADLPELHAASRRLLERRRRLLPPPRGVAADPKLWGPLGNLHRLQARLAPRFAMGCGDAYFLGDGWHALERWAAGPVRWCSGSAEAFLTPAPGARQVRVRVFSGGQALGERVAGHVEVSRSADGAAFDRPARQHFTLPADRWEDLLVQLPEPTRAGEVLRVAIVVDNPRVPAQLAGGVGDTRELGLVVVGMAAETGPRA